MEKLYPGYEDGLVSCSWGISKKQCLMHWYLFILFYSWNYSAFKEISLLFKIIPVIRYNSMNLEKWFYFIFARSSPGTNYKCMSAMYGFSGQILFQDWRSCYTVYPSINILKCQKLHFLRVGCQFPFYLEQFTQQKSKRFDSCSHWGKD